MRRVEEKRRMEEEEGERAMKEKLRIHYEMQGEWERQAYWSAVPGGKKGWEQRRRGRGF